MARFRAMRASINSIKHFVPKTKTTVTAGSVSTHQIVHAVAQSAVVNTDDVVEGSIIKAIFCELWFGSDDSSTWRSFTMTLEKIVGDAASPTLANLTNLMAYPNKKNVIYTTQGIIGPNKGGNAVPVIRQWFAIPKGKQRFSIGDRFELNYLSLDGQTVICGMFIYKEYK